MPAQQQWVARTNRNDSNTSWWIKADRQVEVAVLCTHACVRGALRFFTHHWGTGLLPPLLCKYIRSNTQTSPYFNKLLCFRPFPFKSHPKEHFFFFWKWVARTQASKRILQQIYCWISGTFIKQKYKPSPRRFVPWILVQQAGRTSRNRSVARTAENWIYLSI